MKEIENNTSKDLEEDGKRNKYLNYGYDFGIILFHLAKKDPLSAFTTARAMIIEAMNKVLERGKGSQKAKENTESFNNKLGK